MYVCMYVM